MAQNDVILGIDPGLTGAVAILNAQGVSMMDALRTPTLKATKRGQKTEYDLPGMRNILLHHDPLLVGIEKVHSMPHDGHSSAFRFGQGYGLWLGLLAGLGIPFVELPPQRWQSRMLAGHPRGAQTKISAVKVSQGLWPDIPIHYKADWGMADAALIGEYARRYHLEPHTSGGT